MLSTQSGVPHGTVAHSTRPDEEDVLKVMNTVLKEDILTPKPGRKHNAFKKLHLDPLHKWDIQKTRDWIEKKKRDYVKLRGFVPRDSDSEDEDNNSDSGDEDTDDAFVED